MDKSQNDEQILGGATPEQPVGDSLSTQAPATPAQTSPQFVPPDATSPQPMTSNQMPPQDVDTPQAPLQTYPQMPAQNIDAPQTPPQTPLQNPPEMQMPPQTPPTNTPVSDPMLPQPSKPQKKTKLIILISAAAAFVVALMVAGIILAANGTFAMWFTSSTDAATVSISEKTGTLEWKNNWTWLDYDKNWSEETTSKNKQILSYQPSNGAAHIMLDGYSALDKITTEDFSSEEVRNKVYDSLCDATSSDNSYAEDVQKISSFQVLREAGEEDNKQTYYYAIADWANPSETVRQFYVAVPERNVVFFISANVDKNSDFAKSPQKMHSFYRDALAVVKTITTSLSVNSDESLTEWNFNKSQRTNVTLGTKLELDGTYKIFNSNGTLSFNLSEQQMTVASKNGEKTQTIAFRDVKTAEKYSNGRKVKYYQFVYDSSSGNEIKMLIALIDHGYEGIEIQYNRTQDDYTTSTQYGVKISD